MQSYERNLQSALQRHRFHQGICQDKPGVITTRHQRHVSGPSLGLGLLRRRGVLLGRLLSRSRLGLGGSRRLSLGRGPESLRHELVCCRSVLSNWRTYEVVAEELHDEGAVLVALLAQCVELCGYTMIRSRLQTLWGNSKLLTSNGIIESLLGKVASLVGGIENLVVEDGVVEGEAETDGVSGGQLSLSNLGSRLVGLKGLVGRVLALVANGKLGKITVVVTLPI